MFSPHPKSMSMENSPGFSYVTYLSHIFIQQALNPHYKTLLCPTQCIVQVQIRTCNGHKHIVFLLYLRNYVML